MKEQCRLKVVQRIYEIADEKTGSSWRLLTDALAKSPAAVLRVLLDLGVIFAISEIFFYGGRCYQLDLRRGEFQTVD